MYRNTTDRASLIYSGLPEGVTSPLPIFIVSLFFIFNYAISEVEVIMLEEGYGHEHDNAGVATLQCLP
jgi:hypothetical protein